MSLARKGGFNPTDVEYIITDNLIHMFFPDGRVYQAILNADTYTARTVFIKVDDNLWVDDPKSPSFVIKFEDSLPKYYNVVSNSDAPAVTNTVTVRKGKYYSEYFIEISKGHNLVGYTSEALGEYSADAEGMVNMGSFTFLFGKDMVYELEQSVLTQLSEEDIESFIEEHE